MPNVRDARPQDIPALHEAQLHVARRFDGLIVCEPEELAEADFHERLASASSGKGKCLVVEDDSFALVAHASLRPMGLQKIAHVLRLDMCVHIGHWRQGHGQRLLEALIDWARREPAAHKIELLVRSENQPALALYRKLGFIEEGRLKQRVRLRSGVFLDDLTLALFV